MCLWVLMWFRQVVRQAIPKIVKLCVVNGKGKRLSMD